MNKRVISVLAASVLCLTASFNIYADTKTDAQNQKKEAESKLDSINDDIEALEGSRGDVEEEIAQIDAELVDLLLTVDIIEDDIAEKKVEIDEATVEYEAAKEKEEQQQEAMKLRIKFMYERGDKSYIDMLADSQSISDIINKSDYIEKLYSFDRQLLDEYQATKQEVFELKTRLENEMADLEELHADYEEQSVTLQAIIDEKRESLEDFDEQLASAQAKADEYRSEIKAQTAVIKQIEAEEAAERKRLEEEARQRALAEAKRKQEEEEKRKAEEEERRKAEENNKESEKSEDSDNSNNSESSDNSDNSNNSDTEKQEEKQEEKEEKKESYDNSPGDSSKGQEIVNYAMQFVGNPYVPGGTSLTDGCDCSGFTQSVFSHFGISLPRNSGSQSGAGRAVSYESAQPGDIIYYGGHVGIYIGNGQIVHASTPATGIKVSNAMYRSIITVRRMV